MVSLDEFLAAERQQESGGDYGVVNSIGAEGAYQIMRYHIADWSKAALGHSISEHEFLTHPDEQDAIARYEFAPVFQKYGPAGAAAWWYSGQTDPTKTYGHPPVYQYVREVLARIGKAGTVTGGKSGSGASPVDDTSGSAVHTAGLQQAGYEAALNLTPWGIPLNPFKLPGWLGGKLGDAAGGAAGALGTGLADALGPIILAGIGVAAGAGVILLGLYVTAKPAVDKTAQTAAQLAPLDAI